MWYIIYLAPISETSVHLFIYFNIHLHSPNSFITQASSTAVQTEWHTRKGGLLKDGREDQLGDNVGKQVEICIYCKYKTHVFYIT